MKKILCLIDTLGFGGAERQMMGLVSYLKEKGYEANLVCYIKHSLKDYVMQNYGYNPITLDAGNSMISKLMAVRKHIKQNKYDTVIAYKDGATSLMCILKLLGGSYKLIVSERNTTQVLTKRNWMKFNLYRFADYIIPNSYTQSLFINRKFPFLSQKVITITNYTDIDYFKNYYKKQNSPIEILIVARVAPQKNVLNFIDAVRIVAESEAKVHFSWYGDVRKGLEDYAQSCLVKVNQLNLNSYISFYPATKTILKEYQQSDVFCLPSLYEGYPNTLCEAMSCELPIICSNICDNPNIVCDGVNAFLFDPKSPKDIANKIIKLCSLPIGKIKEMGRNSRRIAEEQFHKDIFVQKYIKLIES